MKAGSENGEKQEYSPSSYLYLKANLGNFSLYRASSSSNEHSYISEPDDILSSIDKILILTFTLSTAGDTLIITALTVKFSLTPLITSTLVIFIILPLVQAEGNISTVISSSEPDLRKTVPLKKSIVDVSGFVSIPILPSCKVADMSNMGASSGDCFITVTCSSLKSAP